jgi:protocatechuate 3,4-dioxygenase beta subunit
VNIAVQRLARVRGQIVNQTTGKGIPNARLVIIAPGKEGREHTHGWSHTNAAGSFDAYVRPGTLQLAVGVPPLGYLAPEKPPPETHTVAAGASATFAPLALEPFVAVEGIVEDAAGRPVPSTRVLTAHDSPRQRPPIWTDAAGRFTVKELGPKDGTALHVRTTTAVTAGAFVLDVARQKGPIKLVISEANAFRLHGKVHDNLGKPVADAAVSVGWHYRTTGPFPRFGFNATLETYRTDAAGRFETQALWPGDEYTMHVAAPGHGRAESVTVLGKAGQRHDVGTIVLPRTAGSVAGVVVDESGRPVAGARVFNQGDAPTRLETTADAAGRFQLQGLFEGPAYLFVREPGRRFTMVRAQTGDTAATIRLLPAGTPASEQPAPRSEVEVAAERKLTRHLLEQLWALPRSVTDGFERDVFEAMARFDLARAKTWLAAEAKQRPGAVAALRRMVRVAEAERAAVVDADEALALLAPLPPGAAFEALLHLAEHTEKTNPAAALRFVEEAVVKARARKLPERASSLAQAGDLALRLGQKAAGQKLLSEAADAAGQLGTDGMHGYIRSKVAGQVAAVDRVRALALIKSIKTSERLRWTAEIIVRRAMLDLDEALTLLDELKEDGSSLRSATRVRIAYALAVRNPARAVKQAEAINVMHRTFAFSGIAVRVAPREPALARGLIDRAFDLYLDKPEAFRRLSGYGGRTAFAAWTAYDARLVGHPDMASVVAHVLATRPTTKENYSASDVSRTLLQAAIPLALADPATGRRLLEQALPADRPISTEDDDRGLSLIAVALVAPDRATGMVDRLIEQARKSKDGLDGTVLITLMSTLTAPTEQRRIRELSRWIERYWIPLYNEE